MLLVLGRAEDFYSAYLTWGAVKPEGFANSGLPGVGRIKAKKKAKKARAVAQQQAQQALDAAAARLESAVGQFTALSKRVQGALGALEQIPGNDAEQRRSGLAALGDAVAIALSDLEGADSAEALMPSVVAVEKAVSGLVNLERETQHEARRLRAALEAQREREQWAMAHAARRVAERGGPMQGESVHDAVMRTVPEILAEFEAAQARIPTRIPRPQLAGVDSGPGLGTCAVIAALAWWAFGR